MYSDLTGLEGFNYHKQTNSYATVQEGVLRIVGRVSYEKMTICACYRKHGLICAYCGTELTKDTKTVDHKIPRIYGGVSILDNLVPSCKKCNEDKSNLIYDEYIKMREIQDYEDRKRYKLACIGRHEKEVLERGFCIPTDWLEKDTQTILVDFDFTEDYKKSGRYTEIEEFYFKFGLLPKPIVISGNNKLLDGFVSLMFAKNEGLVTIPLIKLENVIVE